MFTLLPLVLVNSLPPSLNQTSGIFVVEDTTDNDTDDTDDTTTGDTTDTTDNVGEDCAEDQWSCHKRGKYKKCY